MSDTRNCAECGAPLPSYWPKGLCAQCALDGALEMSDGESQVFQPEGPSAPANLQSPQSGVENAPLGAFGDYDLLEEIARGGMGIVYKARQRKLDRIVAVKMILAGQLAGKEFVRRFRTEASAAAVLQHPGIVAIHDVGVHEGRNYFSMDYVDGPNLAQLVGRQPLSPPRAARCLEHIAEAIHYAHERGILHRDLKPSNVIVDTETDLPRVTDFGLAKRFKVPPSGDSAATESLTPGWDLTITGQVLGSPNFMPPEQAGGKRGKVGRASDVYALGGILYYLLTARAPFEADSLEHTISQVLHDEPVAPRLLIPSIPRDLETITLKCLEKEPSRRYPTAQELADELGRVLRKEPIQARPVSLTEKLWRWCRRKPALAGSLAAVVVLLTVVAIGSPIAVVRVRREQQKVAVQARELGLNLYAADVYLAQNAIRDGNYGLAQQALQAHFPKQGERDLRGFEWCFFWRLLQGDKWAAWHAHANVVSSIAVSPNAKLIASGGADHQTRLWDAASHRLLKMFPQADCTAFSADGNLLLTASEEGLVQVFDVETLERKSAFMTADPLQKKPVGDNDRTVAYLAASPTEPILAVCTDGRFFGGRGSVRLYNYLTSEELGTLTNSGNRMAFSRDGRILVTGSCGDQIKVWNVATRKQLKAFGHVGGISSLALAPDGRLLATTEFWSGDIRLWDVDQGVELSPLRGHTVMTWHVAFSRDGKRLASGSSDQTIRIWDVAGRTQVRTLIGHASEVWAVAFSPDGGYLVSGSKDETVAVWPPGDPAKDDTIKVANTVRNPPLFSPDGRVLAAAGGGGEVAGELVLWSVASATVQAVLPGERAGLWFSPDAQTLLTLSTNNSELHFWDLPRQVIRETISLAPQMASVRGAVASTDGERVAAASDDGPTIALWERRSGVRKVIGQIQSVNCLEFSPDHRLLAACGGALVEVWDVEAGTVLWTLRGHKDGVSAIAFSPDGDTLASCSVDNTAKLWSLSRRRELATLEGHREGVKWVAFTPDGNTLATACADGSLKLWHVPTRREIASFKRLSRAWFTRFSPDGKSLAYAAGWGSLILLRCPSRTEIDLQRRGEGTLSDGVGIDKTTGTTVSRP